MIVIQGKNISGICVCVTFHVLVEACVHGPFPTSIRDEISKKVIENEAYSFI